MRWNRFRLLLLAGALAGAALLSSAAPAHAIFCWHVDENTSCCRLASGEIVCG